MFSATIESRCRLAVLSTASESALLYAESNSVKTCLACTSYRNEESKRIILGMTALRKGVAILLRARERDRSASNRRRRIDRLTSQLSHHGSDTEADIAEEAGARRDAGVGESWRGLMGEPAEPATVDRIVGQLGPRRQESITHKQGSRLADDPPHRTSRTRRRRLEKRRLSEREQTLAEPPASCTSPARSRVRPRGKSYSRPEIPYPGSVGDADVSRRRARSSNGSAPLGLEL